MPIRAALFDFGGVILTSPFDAFARYERDNGLPEGFLRALNARNPDDNAWARMERSEVDLAGFCELFEAEALEAGHRVVGADVLVVVATQDGKPVAVVVDGASVTEAKRYDATRSLGHVALDGASGTVLDCGEDVLRNA